MVRRRRNQGDARHRVTQACNQGIHLAAWQLTALAGLGTLSHLDLHHIGTAQIFRRDTKATGCYLLDFGPLYGAMAGWVFTALT